MQRLLLCLSRFAVGLFYRIEEVGRKVPAEGPVLLVANHPNGLVDPVLVASTTGRAVRLLAKAPLFEMPVIGALMRAMQALPVFRAQDGADTAQNERTFAVVFEALRQGDLVCLFPEGKSHDEPTLQKLKTGAARMALGAAAGARGSLGVRIIPVGLVYRAKRRFRSRVGVCVGDAIGLQDLLGLHAVDEREAVRRLTQRIAEGLGKVTLHLEHWDELPLLELASSTLSPTTGSDPTQIQAFSHRLWQLRSGEASCTPELEQRIAELTLRLSSFRDRLRSLKVGSLAIHPRYPASSVVRFVLLNSIRLCLTLPVALLGSILWAPPYLLITHLVRWLKTERDQYATVQILSAMLLFPLWWVGLSLAAWGFGGAGLAWTAFLAIPLTGLTALYYRDWRQETLPDVRAFLRLGNRKHLRELLHAERRLLASEIQALGERLEERAS